MNWQTLEDLIQWGLELFRQGAQFGINAFFVSMALILAGMLVARVCRRHGPVLQSVIYRSTLAAICLGCAIALLPTTPAASPFGSWAISLPEATTTKRIQNSEVGLRSTNNLGPANLESAALSSEVFDRQTPRARKLQPESVTPSEPRSAHETVEVADAFVLQTNPPSRPAAAIWSQVTYAGNLYFVIAVLWSAGCLWRLIKIGVGWQQLKSIRKNGSQSEDFQRSLARIADQIGIQCPPVIRSPQITSPCLVGVTAPVILLPTEMTDDESIQRAIVHEMAHLRRHDNLWNWGQRVLHAFFWFQPLMISLIRRIEHTAEEVCDDDVIRYCGDRTLYAQQLLNMATANLAEANLLGVGMLKHPSTLSRRIARIVDSQRELARPLNPRIIATVFSTACFFAILIGISAGTKTLGNAPSQERPSSKPRINLPTARTTKRLQADSPAKAIHGVVQTEQGQPISGAHVQFVLLDDWPDLNRRVVATAKTDSNGRYTFDMASATLQDIMTQQVAGYVLVRADGFAGQQRNWMDQPKSNTDLSLNSAQLNFTLYSQQLIRGQVVDSAGRPIGDAVVETVWARRLSPEIANKWLVELGKTKSRYDADDLIPGSRDGVSDWSVGTRQRSVTTNEQGEFEIKDIAGDAKLELQISHPRFITTGLTLLNRTMKDDDSHPGHPLFGNRPTITLKPCRPIKGAVVDAKTGKPIPNAIIRSQEFGALQMQVSWGVVPEARTDANGRFELLGMPNSDQSRLAVFLGKDSGNEIAYLPQTIRDLPKTAGAKPVELSIEMERGVWIRGRVVNRNTGQGVLANVVYTPFESNPNVKNIRAFNRKDSLRQFEFMDGFRSDRAGNFRVPGLPGPGVLAAYSHDESFRKSAGLETIREKFGVGLSAERIKIYEESGIDASKWKTIPTRLSVPHQLGHSSSYVAIEPKLEKEFNQDIELDPGQAVKLKVIDRTGEPIEKFIVYGYRDTWDKKEFQNGVATIERVGRDESKPILIESKIQQLAIATKILFQPDSEVQTITLAPYCKVKGRLAGPDGIPLRRHWIEIESEKVQADDDGRFAIDNIAVGRFSPGKLEVRIYNPQETTMAGMLLKVELQPGKTVELDDLIFSADQFVEFSIGAVGD